MNIKFNPGVEPVKEVKATISLTISLRDAQVLRALLGKLAGRSSGGLYPLYDTLDDVLRLHDPTGIVHVTNKNAISIEGIAPSRS